MTPLPDHRIAALGPNLITPYDEDRVQPASYDLALGNEFTVFDAHEQVCIDLECVNDLSAKKVVLDKDDGGFILHPGEFVLAVTAESVKLPNDIMARLEGKSSIGRLGVMIHVTAGFVDPGWEGQLTLEVYNVRKIPIILRPGLPFCQISFAYMESAVANPYEGRYQGARGVEASKYGRDLEDVRAEQLGRNIVGPEITIDVRRPITGGMLGQARALASTKRVPRGFA